MLWEQALWGEILQLARRKLPWNLNLLRWNPPCSYLCSPRDRITTLNSKLAFEPIYIGLFGSSGAGKSTLLNTILHKRFFLPVSGTRACTSCQVQISTSSKREYGAKIFLLSSEVRLGPCCGREPRSSSCPFSGQPVHRGGLQEVPAAHFMGRLGKPKGRPGKPVAFSSLLLPGVKVSGRSGGWEPSCCRFPLLITAAAAPAPASC